MPVDIYIYLLRVKLVDEFVQFQLRILVAPNTHKTPSMKLKDLIQYQSFVFHILGQHSHINAWPILPNHCATVLRYVPTIFLLLLATTLSITAIIYQLYLEAARIDRTDSIVGTVFIFSELIGSLTVIGQSFFRRHQLSHLIDNFYDIERYLRLHFHLIQDYRAFRQNYLWCVTIATCLYTLMIVLKLTMPTIYNILMLEIAISVMRLLSLIARLHVLFYVSLLRHFMRHSVKETLFGRMNLVHGVVMWRLDDVVTVIRQMKCLHFKLYELAMQISDVFGWNMVAQSVECFFDGAYGVYWIFFYLQKDDGEIYVIRNYYYYYYMFHSLK